MRIGRIDRNVAGDGKARVYVARVRTIVGMAMSLLSRFLVKRSVGFARTGRARFVCGAHCTHNGAQDSKAFYAKKEKAETGKGAKRVAASRPIDQ